MKTFLLKPDRSQPPLELFPSLFAEWRELVREWAAAGRTMDSDDDVREAVAEVERRTAAKREAAMDRNPGLFR